MLMVTMMMLMMTMMTMMMTLIREDEIGRETNIGSRLSLSCASEDLSLANDLDTPANCQTQSARK